MKFEVLSTITVDTRSYPFCKGEIDVDHYEDDTLTFTFKTNDLAKIIFRGGPNQLRVDEKILCMLDSGGVTLTSSDHMWMVKNARKFFSDCIEAYVKARNFEIGVLANVTEEVQIKS